jgi:Probable transposase
VAKVGRVRVRWSRELPSVPSSVTLIREPDGRFYASFVVERDSSPLPAVTRTAGIDLGLISFATIAGSDGTIETIANPRHLRAAERRLTRAQRQLSRKQKGSKNRAKARLRVAVAHRRVRDRRADHHHKLALRLIRENQAIAVEDHAVAGLAPDAACQERPRRWVGDVSSPAASQGRTTRPSGCQGRPLGADLPDLLGVWASRRPQAARCPGLGLPGVQGGPRPGR